MEKKTPLKRAVRKILLRRLCVTALVVALLFAVLSYYHARGMVTDAVVQAVTQRLGVVQGRFSELMSRPGAQLDTVLQDAVRYPPGVDTHIEEGEFVYARLHSGDRQSSGMYEHPDYASLGKVREYLLRTPKANPQSARLEYEQVIIDGRPYLDIHGRLTGGDSGSALFLRAVFAFSQQSLASIQRQVAQTVLYVIALVMATAMLLYPVIVHLINKVADYSTGLLTAQLETMEALGEAIAKRDSDTNSHNYRVTIYSVALGEKLSLAEQQMQRLIKGAFLHDVGKIGIRDDILLNKSHLTEAEFAIMKNHVRYGLEIIRTSSWLREAGDVVGSHHEKYDGSGYPAGLVADEIPINARIFALTDVFDALTSRRPYKEPYSCSESMAIMEKGRLHHFDPLLLDLFQEISSDLYADCFEVSEEGLREKLLAITDTYFHSGVDTLLY